LQEIDLVQGDTVLGRSPECHVTIEDPLVSRMHARIVIQGSQATIQDLGSRNGEPIDTVTGLRDRDRIRIGMQEFVFLAVSPKDPRIASKSTGFLQHCERCDYPYPEGSPVCPNCGYEATREPEESTLSGVVGDNKANWASQLLLELMDRALAVGRWEEAEQVLKRARAAVDERLAIGEMDPSQLSQLLGSASKIAQTLQAEHWVTWIMESCARIRRAPSADVVARLRTVPLRHHDVVIRAIDAIVEEQVPAARDEALGIAALLQWRKELSVQE